MQQAAKLWRTVATGFRVKDREAHDEMIDLADSLESASRSSDPLDREFTVLRAQEMQRKYGPEVKKRFA